MAEETMDEALGRMQDTIDALNTSIERRDATIVDLQHQLDISNESSQQQIATATVDLQRQLDAGLANATNQVAILHQRWEAQNHYIVTLEAQIMSGVLNQPDLTLAFKTLVKANKAAALDQLQRELSA